MNNTIRRGVFNTVELAVSIAEHVNFSSLLRINVIL
jgi:hypothetical protein